MSKPEEEAGESEGELLWDHIQNQNGYVAPPPKSRPSKGPWAKKASLTRDVVLKPFTITQVFTAGKVKERDFPIWFKTPLARGNVDGPLTASEMMWWWNSGNRAECLASLVAAVDRAIPPGARPPGSQFMILDTLLEAVQGGGTVPIITAEDLQVPPPEQVDAETHAALLIDLHEDMTMSMDVAETTEAEEIAAGQQALMQQANTTREGLEADLAAALAAKTAAEEHAAEQVAMQQQTETERARLESQLKASMEAKGSGLDEEAGLKVQAVWLLKRLLRHAGEGAPDRGHGRPPAEVAPLHE